MPAARAATRLSVRAKAAAIVARTAPAWNPALVMCTRQGTVPSGRVAATCPMAVKSGYPGGWGTPQRAAAVTSSAESPSMARSGHTRAA